MNIFAHVAPGLGTEKEYLYWMWFCSLYLLTSWEKNNWHLVGSVALNGLVGQEEKAVCAKELFPEVRKRLGTFKHQKHWKYQLRELYIVTPLQAVKNVNLWGRETLAERMKNEVS